MTKHVGDCVYTRISRLPTDVKGNVARDGRLRTRATMSMTYLFSTAYVYMYDFGFNNGISAVTCHRLKNRGQLTRQLRLLFTW